MKRAIGRLADTLLSAVAPKSTASAAYIESYCTRCTPGYWIRFWRMCANNGCGDWVTDGCGSC